MCGVTAWRYWRDVVVYLLMWTYGACNNVVTQTGVACRLWFLVWWRDVVWLGNTNYQNLRCMACLLISPFLLFPLSPLLTYSPLSRIGKTEKALALSRLARWDGSSVRILLVFFWCCGYVCLHFFTFYKRLYLSLYSLSLLPSHAFIFYCFLLTFFALDSGHIVVFGTCICHIAYTQESDHGAEGKNTHACITSIPDILPERKVQTTSKNTTEKEKPG